MSEAVERRRESRHERGDMGLVLAVDGREISDAGQTLIDISDGGLGIHIAGMVRVGQEVEFRLGLNGGQVAGRGSVQWVRDCGGGFRCGVKTSLGFLDRIRLRNFLEPNANDLIGSIDGILFIAAFAVVLLSTTKFFGIELASVSEVVEFYFG